MNIIVIVINQSWTSFIVKGGERKRKMADARRF